ncbi:MAG: hypothetical protein ABI947_01000 [Chloroflexota bacterium]
MMAQRTAIAERAEMLYQTLLALGVGWHGRAEIAAQLGKRQLSSYDGAALEVLIQEGRVEAERHEIDSPIPVRWEYRIIEK